MIIKLSMSKLTLKKIFHVFILAAFLISLGAAAPAPEAVWGDDDPDKITEVFRTGKCGSYGGGLGEFIKKVFTGKWKDMKFDYCPCIPVDLGELTDLSKLLSNIWGFVTSIPAGFWKGEFDIGITTKSPHLEKTMITVWQEGWEQDAMARTLVRQAEAMIASINLTRSNILLSAYNSNMSNLSYSQDRRSRPIDETYNMSWMPAGEYTGLTNMLNEETRLNNRLRELQRTHIKAMKAIADNYSGVKSSMNSLYTELMKNDGEADPFGKITELYNKVKSIIDLFNTKWTVGNFFSNAQQIVSSISSILDLLNGNLLGDISFNKRMMIFDVLGALKDDVALNWKMWIAAVLDKNPTYPLSPMVKETFLPVIKDLISLLFIVPPEKGQTKVLQVVTAMADQHAGFIELLDHAIDKFHDPQQWYDQAQNAKKQAIKTNVTIIAGNAAKPKPKGKSYKLGF